jgi:hypothetical protein
MEAMIQALRVENLETRLGLHQFVCASLELESEFAPTVEARKSLAHRRVQEIRECDVLQFALELLKREAE